MSITLRSFAAAGIAILVCGACSGSGESLGLGENDPGHAGTTIGGSAGASSTHQGGTTSQTGAGGGDTGNGGTDGSGGQGQGGGAAGQNGDAGAGGHLGSGGTTGGSSGQGGGSGGSPGAGGSTSGAGGTAGTGGNSVPDAGSPGMDASVVDAGPDGAAACSATSCGPLRHCCGKVCIGLNVLCLADAGTCAKRCINSDVCCPEGKVCCGSACILPKPRIVCPLE